MRKTEGKTPKWWHSAEGSGPGRRESSHCFVRQSVHSNEQEADGNSPSRTLGENTCATLLSLEHTGLGIATRNKSRTSFECGKETTLIGDKPRASPAHATSLFLPVPRVNRVMPF